MVAASAGRSPCAINARFATTATTSASSSPGRATGRHQRSRPHSAPGRHRPQSSRSQRLRPRVDRKAFEQLVAEALASIPRRFRKAMQNIAIVVEDEPDEDLLDDMEIEPPDTLLGLYMGT